MHVYINSHSIDILQRWYFVTMCDVTYYIWCNILYLNNENVFEIFINQEDFEINPLIFSQHCAA